MRESRRSNRIGLALLAYACFAANPAAAGERLKSLSRAYPAFAPVAECAALEDQLGQLLYVNVDGFAGTKEAIWPEYVALVRGLKIGGVLPHFGPSSTLPKIRDAVSKLKAATELPLLLGVDYAGPFGLGYGGGALAHYDRKIPDACLPIAGRLEGLLHRSYGLNQALGPTLERSGAYSYLNIPGERIAEKARALLEGLRQTGVVATMKHFPYTPSSYNLHKTTEMAACSTEDTRAAKLAEFANASPAFGALASGFDFAMTTHVFNCAIDAEDVATFSATWVRKLREEAGFRGLLMTDALFMFGKYSDVLQDIFSRWPGRELPVALGKLPNGSEAIYAARAILAGHDFAFLEGTAQQTRQVFDGLLYASCQATPEGAALRARVSESYARIRAWKLANAASLRQAPWEMPADGSVLALHLKLQKGGADATQACAREGLALELDQAIQAAAKQAPAIAFDGQPGVGVDSLSTPKIPKHGDLDDDHLDH